VPETSEQAAGRDTAREHAVRSFSAEEAQAEQAAVAGEVLGGAEAVERATAPPPIDPTKRFGPEGGHHLARSYSRDPGDFDEPTSRQELWRFAALRTLRPLFAEPDADGSVGFSFDDDAPVRRIGMDDPRVGSVFTPFDRVGAVAMRQAPDALLVELTDRRDEPVFLTAKGSPGTAYGHLVIDVAAGAGGTVVIDHVGAATYAANTEYRIGDGASLTVVHLQDWDDGAIHVESQTASVGRDAHLKHVVVTLGGEAVRICPTVRLDAPGGEAELLGLSFGDAGQHSDTRLLIEHHAPHCRSRATFKGALNGAKARSVWTGDVLIGADAIGTDSYEVNNNLLLSDGARADSVPNLEILTGEVIRAAHASTTGRFDDEALFYLRSRGIPPEEARRLVVRGFFADVISRIGIPDVEARLLAAVEAELETAATGRSRPGETAATGRSRPDETAATGRSRPDGTER
jgi:Fe-S cluster assembly protein SufD